MASLNWSITWLLLWSLALTSLTLTDANHNTRSTSSSPISSDGIILTANQFVQSNLSSQQLRSHYIYKGRSDDGFVLFYAVTQYYPITASLKPSTSSDYTLTSRNPGLIHIFNDQNGNQTAHLYLSLSSDDAKLKMDDPTWPPFVITQLVAVPSKNFAPLPGGCCLTCDLDIDPNIILTPSFWITWISFAEANAGFQNDKQPACGGTKPSRFRLKYDLYQLFLPEWTIDSKELFTNIRYMITPEQIRKYGKFIRTFNGGTKNIIAMNSVFGHGTVYGVIVRDPFFSSEAAYSPATTYFCNLTQNTHRVVTCKTGPYNYFATILAIVLSAGGLCMCLFSSKIFKVFLFCNGCLIGGIIIFVVVAVAGWLKMQLSLQLTVAVIASILTGVIFVVIWYAFGICLFILAFLSSPLGFLITSVALTVTPLGLLTAWTRVNFALLFVLMFVIFALLSIIFTKSMSIITPAVTGAYLFLFGISHFVHVSFGLFILSIFRHALVGAKVNILLTSVPFTSDDWIFCSVWAILSIVGIALQYRLRSKGVPFPQSPLIFYLWWQKRKNIELLNTNNGPADHITEDANANSNGIEQSPLLRNEKHSYGTNW